MSDWPKDCCLHQLIEAQVERTPDAVAVVFEATSLSYRELDVRADQVADWLRERGVQPEISVGVFMERSLEIAIAVLGIFKAGGVVVPLDPEYPRQRIERIVQQTATRIILTRTDMAGRIPSTEVTLLCVDEAVSTSTEKRSNSPNRTLTADNLCAIFFTSGSTGEPKGVLVPHRVSNRILWAQEHAIPLGPSDRRLLTSSLNHASFLGEFCAPLFVGAAVVFARPDGYQDIDYLLEAIATNGITVIGFVPSVLALLAGRIAIEGAQRCRSLRHIFSHGDAMLPELQRLLSAHLEAAVHKFYGLTEAPAVAYWNCRNAADLPWTTIGRPTDMEVYLLDDKGQPVRDGVAGEIYIGGDGMARGYLNEPELTAKRFVANPFSSDPNSRLFRTGDLGRWRAEGAIEFLGRVDDQIKIRGFRIEPGEIEACIGQVPGVETAAIIPFRGQSGETALAGYYEGDSSDQTVQAIKSRLAEKLPIHMRPAVLTHLTKMPLTPNGKTDRKALPVPNLSASAPLAPESFADDIERGVASLWEELLNITNVGPTDDYFALGGSSLVAARLFAEIGRRFGVKLPLTTILDASTVRMLSRRIKLKGPDRSGALVELKPGGRRHLFLVHDGDCETFLYMNLARRMPADLSVVGIEPRRLPGIPFAHGSVEEVAAYYVEEIRRRQPKGPYLLGGMCAGGIIAYEMASQLMQAGESVNLVVMLETATSQAPKRWGRVATQRIERLSQALRATQDRKHFAAMRALWTIFRKSVNMLRWEISLRTSRFSARTRFHILRVLLAHSKPWPRFLPQLTARQICGLAEASFVPKPLLGTRPLLVRARTGKGDDTPFLEIYQDQAFGWAALAKDLEIVDVDGGHSSMLQEPFVNSLAAALIPYLKGKSNPARGSLELEET